MANKRPPLPDALKPLLGDLKKVMRADYFRLHRQLHQLGEKGAPNEQALEKLKSRIQSSSQRRQRRVDLTVHLEYPEDLPVSERRGDILEALKKNQVILVCGETGSGKTTQLPKICLEAGRGREGMIGHTQPRRLAARAVSQRLAEEMKTEVGGQVGYKVRFSDQVSEHSLVKVMTDGILLADIQQDRWLNQYDTLIIDEAHERSLNIDFLMGYLKTLLRKRRDLKLIITSATIDAQRIADHFDKAPIIEVSGRTFPVDILYRPLLNPDSEADDLDLNQAIDASIDEQLSMGRGDILVFLPGEREIREASHALRHRRDRMEILPLYARLSAAEQQKIFKTGGRLRVILTTNVAETSLTVPGIRYVIDAGTARISRYSWRSKVQRLPVEKVSQASANQRSGRCGRIGPGVCIRLYDEEDFNHRPEFTDAEILRTNLASVILQMAMLRLGDPMQFPFIDVPDPRLIKDGYRLLEELHAVDAKRNLTPLGKQLGKLPIDPRLGRMLLAAAKTGATSEVLAIITALAVQDPRERPYEKRQASDEQHARFKHEKSDFLAILNLWFYLENRTEELSQSKLRKLCQKEFLSYRRWREWRDTHHQLKLALKDLNISLNEKEAGYEQVHKALLTGLLDQIGLKDEKQEYLGTRNRRFHIFPGSGLGKKSPKWVMAGEITETTKLYARTVAGIQPEWVEDLGAHLLHHSYSEPHWVRSKARVGGYEKLTLGGLIINPKKPVNYAAIDPVVSREIFIRHALVMGEYKTNIPSLLHNRKLVDEIEDLEARSRRRDLLINEQDMYDFYDRHIPDHVNSGASFDTWHKKLKDPKLLRFDHEELKTEQVKEVDPRAFPKQYVQKNLKLPLSYCFDPGNDRDGVTLHVPISVLKQLDEARISWLVPGMVEEKVQALIKSLPKALRKNFVPAPDFARAALNRLDFGKGLLAESLGTELHAMTGTAVENEDWGTTFEPHLLMRFEVVDPQRKVVASGRDLQRLIQQFQNVKPETTHAPAAKSRPFEREDLHSWDFGDLPDSVECEEAGYTIQRYPSLVVEKKGISLRLLDSEDEAAECMPQGLRQLLLLQLKQEARYLDKNIPEMSQHCLRYSAIGTCQQLKRDLLETAVQHAFLDGKPLPRQQEAFLEMLEEGRAHLVDTATGIASHLGPILDSQLRIRKKLKGSLPLSWIEASADIKTQMESLVYPGFLLETPATVLPELERYLGGIEKRLEKLSNAPDRDRMNRVQVEPLQEKLEALPLKKRQSQGAQDFRWLLEELRISLFAQELGTKKKVSAKRLDTFWKESLKR